MLRIKPGSSNDYEEEREGESHGTDDHDESGQLLLHGAGALGFSRG